ncbi:hypothetical protein BJ170DRAFT_645719 [Xylariales sp. AK1849]|nr:hypothetical protein BJ170DRAFT_645719 [Xylariales sp. AK1849]
MIPWLLGMDVLNLMLRGCYGEVPTPCLASYKLCDSKERNTNKSRTDLVLQAYVTKEDHAPGFWSWREDLVD